MIVMKFGGSSIATAEKIRRVAGLVKSEIPRRPVVVVSAHGKTTDALIHAGRKALLGKVDTIEIERVHHTLIDELGLDRRLVDGLLNQLSMLLHGIRLIGELTPRTLDQVMSFGERMSVLVMSAAFAAEGIRAVPMNAFDIGLATDAGHGSATPLPGIYDGIASHLLEADGVPVVTGFLGMDPKGSITTLGRSGSDWSASILGAAVAALEVQIWSDVNGVMTCDPSIDPKARNIPALSFEEASELAYFGAEVLHPHTLAPAIEKGIPVRVLNTLCPSDPGTRITAQSVLTSRIAKSVAYKEDVCLIHIESPRIVTAAVLLGRASAILAEHKVGIHMAATSEASVSLVTDRPYDEEELERPLSEIRKLGRTTVERRKAILCVVGEELRGLPDAASRIFGAVASKGIQPRMAALSGSRINVAFLIDDVEIEPAVSSLHDLLLSSPGHGQKG